MGPFKENIHNCFMNKSTYILNNVNNYFTENCVSCSLKQDLVVDLAAGVKKPVSTVKLIESKIMT